MYEVVRGIGKFIVRTQDGDVEFRGIGAKGNAYAYAQEQYREDLKADTAGGESLSVEKSDEVPVPVDPTRDFLTDPGPAGSRRGNYARGSESRGGGA